MFRLMTAALVAACVALVGCSSEPRKIKSGDTVVLDLSELLKESKEQRLKECTQDIDDCRLNALFNIADKSFKIEECLKVGYLIQIGDGKWKIYRPLYEFLIEVERRKNPKTEQIPAPKSKP